MLGRAAPVRGLLDVVDSKPDKVPYELGILEVPKVSGFFSSKAITTFLAFCATGISVAAASFSLPLSPHSFWYTGQLE